MVDIYTILVLRCAYSNSDTVGFIATLCWSSLFVNILYTRQVMENIAPKMIVKPKVKQIVLSWNAIQNDMSRTLYINKILPNACLVRFQDIVYNNTIIIIGVLLLV